MEISQKQLKFCEKCEYLAQRPKADGLPGRRRETEACVYPAAQSAPEPSGCPYNRHLKQAVKSVHDPELMHEYNHIPEDFSIPDFLFYSLTLIFPAAGIVAGWIKTRSKSGARRDFGMLLMILGIIMLLLHGVVLYIIFS